MADMAAKFAYVNLLNDLIYQKVNHSFKIASCSNGVIPRIFEAILKTTIVLFFQTSRWIGMYETSDHL